MVRRHQVRQHVERSNGLSRTENQKNSDRHEAGIAKRFGGHVNPGSGSSWKRRQDVRTKEVLFEAKYTGKTQVTIKADVLEQLRLHALQDGRIAALHLEVGGRNYVVLNEADFEELIEGG